MTTRLEVYTDAETAVAIRGEADRLETSASGLFKEALRRWAQDPDSDLDASKFEVKE